MTQTVLLGGVVQINPTTTLKKGTDSKFVSMDKLEPFKRKISSYEEREYKGGSKFMNGDTLLARITPCLENGKTAFVDILGDDEVGAGSTEFVVLRAIEGVTDPNYMYYLSISPEFRNFAIQAMIGTSGRQRVQNDVLARYEFELPGIKIQQKIGEQLRTIDEKIELNRRMNETLEQMGQALFRHYFIDNPEAESWESGTIADLGEVITGKTPSKSKAEYYGDNVMFLKVPDMHGQSIIIKTEDMLSSLGADSQSKKYIPKWSTCVSCIATVGVISLAGEQLQTNQQINSIVPKSNEYTLYNYYLMKSKSEMIKTMASGGSATPNLNKRHFESIKIKLPPIELLREFQREVEDLLDLLDSKTNEIQTLTTLRDTLLPRLINGRARV